MYFLLNASNKKNATTKKYFYTTFAQFETHLTLFLQAYNFGKRLRSLNF